MKGFGYIWARHDFESQGEVVVNETCEATVQSVGLPAERPPDAYFYYFKLEARI